jgi:hypothetical protein
MHTVLDAIGYLIVASTLFFPVLWFVFYFFSEVAHYSLTLGMTIKLEEPAKKIMAEADYADFQKAA